MTEHICAKCGKYFATKETLSNHQNKKIPCDSGKYECKKKCGRRFKSRTGRNEHSEVCDGKHLSHLEKDAVIERLRNTIAATAGLNHEIQAKQQIVNQTNNTNNNITVNDVKNVTQNIVILHCGRENIDHLKKLPFEQLKEEIGFDRDPKTHIEAFKRIRLDPEHPENRNILLTDRDSDKVMFIVDENGWQEGDFNFQIRNAIFDTNNSIGQLIPYKERMESDYYWNHLQHGIARACNERNDIALKPIFDGIRDPLHQATLKLMNMEATEDHSQAMTETCDRQREVGGELALLIEQEKTKREKERTLRENEKERTLRENEKERTRQLELQVELARIQAQKMIQ